MKGTLANRARNSYNGLKPTQWPTKTAQGPVCEWAGSDFNKQHEYPIHASKTCFSYTGFN